MVSLAKRAAFLPVAALALIGCPSTDGNGDGGNIVDVCNSVTEALNDPACALAVNGDAKEAYISTIGDKDYYAIQLPANVTSRSLLQVTGGYGGAAGTTVDFSLNVLRSDGTTSLSSGVDRPGTGVPRDVNLVLTLDPSFANQTLVVIASDDLNAQRDLRAPYRITVAVVENPDINEPNDTVATATPITLTGGTGSAVGYLATPNDNDIFTFSVPAGRRIAYVRVQAALLSPPPPAALRLFYRLFNEAQTPVSEATAVALTAADLSTARLSNTGGTWRLEVRGFRQTSNTIVPGDIRYRYTVTVMTLTDADTNEGASGNDSRTSADSQAAISLGLSSTVRTGRISYVTDADWYRLSLSNGGSASVLHYRVQTTTNGGRFSPLNGPSDRQIRVFTPFGGGAGPCADTANPACPKDLNSPVLATATVFCQQALCTRSMREEDFDYANIRNFEGKIPIPAGGGTYYFVVQDDGTNWADDLDYTVTLTQSSDADEQTRAGLPSQTQTASMGAVDGTNFPAPAPGGAVVSGTLSHGHGRLLNNDPTEGQGVRASRDYDAENDRDRYELTFPGLSAPADRAWALQWDVTEVSGALPGDLLVSLEFCEGVNPACTIVDRTSAGDALGIAYQSGDLVSWHNTFGGAQPIWSQTDLGATQRFQALPAGCFCLERRFGQSGRFFVTVSALDRDTHDTISYTLRSSLAPYPQAYPNPDGGTALSCPAPQDLGGGTYDGGCGFAE